MSSQELITSGSEEKRDLVSNLGSEKTEPKVNLDGGFGAAAAAAEEG